MICIGKQDFQAKNVHCIASYSSFLLPFIQVGCIKFPLCCRTTFKSSFLILGSVEVIYDYYFLGIDSPLAHLQYQAEREAVKKETISYTNSISVDN